MVYVINDEENVRCFSKKSILWGISMKYRQVIFYDGGL